MIDLGISKLALLWFVLQAWFPSIHQAIRNLPAQGAIRQGRLEWAGDSPMPLSDGASSS